MTFDFAPSRRAGHAQRVADSVLTEPDLRELDRLVRESADTLRATSASLSLMSTQQLTVSACGAAESVVQRGSEMAFDDTICANALRHDGPLVIDDALADAWVSTVPSVQLGIVRAYLGAPLHVDGLMVGVLCAADAMPRAWREEDVATLVALAARVERELERIVAASPSPQVDERV